MATPQQKVAVVTGGSGGMGLAVVKALSARGNWQVHIIDLKEAEGKAVAAELPNVFYHKASTTDYEQLGAAFTAAYKQGGNRIDFVHANAGIIERSNLYELKSATDEVPPPPDFASVDVNLRGTINTVHIGRHFILKNQTKDKGAIVITASCASIWPTYFAPIYTSAKFALLGFMRSISGHFKVLDGIRVNALCPGAMRTNLVPDEGWAAFPEDVFTPLELIAKVVLQLNDGEEITDSKGVKVPADKMYGQAVVANGKNFYFHAEPDYCDDVMARTMESTKVENQVGHILE